MNQQTKKPSAMEILQGKVSVSQSTSSKESFRIQIKENKGGGITLYSQDASNKMPQGFKGACNLTVQVIVRLKYLMQDAEFKDYFLQFLEDGQQVMVK